MIPRLTIIIYLSVIYLWRTLHGANMAPVLGPGTLETDLRSVTHGSTAQSRVKPSDCRCIDTFILKITS